MKKLISFIAILSMMGGVAYAYEYKGDGNANTKRAIEGAPAYVAYREYELVRFAENGQNGVQLSAGDVVVADCVSDDGVTIGLAGTVASTDAVKGVVVSPTIPTCDVTGSTAQTDFGRRNWGYIQVKGYCSTVNITGGPSIAGGVIVASSTARFASAPPTANSNYRPMGFAYDASTTAVGEAYIDL